MNDVILQAKQKNWMGNKSAMYYVLKFLKAVHLKRPLRNLLNAKKCQPSQWAFKIIVRCFLKLTRHLQGLHE